MERYHHKQPAVAIWVAMSTTAAVIALIAGAVSLLAPAEERGAVAWVVLSVALLMALFAWLFGSLTVTVDELSITLGFGPGWPRKTLALAEVQGVEQVRNSWWYGWGIRLTPHGWLWNVSGLDAVELELAGGRRFRIGTDEPEALATAIRQAIDT